MTNLHLLAIDLCKLCERKLRDIGWHVGLTGSALYGSKAGIIEDINIIIYPHIADDGSKSEIPPREVLEYLGLTDIEHIEDGEYDCAGYVDYIYTGHHPETGIKIDAFFLK